MRKCVSTEFMRLCDENTIKAGTSGTTLMRRVGLGVWQIIKDEIKGKSVIIACGKGNNGGDGLALAEVMLENGMLPKIALLSEKMSEDSMFFLNNLLSKKRSFNDLTAVISSLVDENFDADYVIDCIFGTGFTGEPKTEIAMVIDKINNSRAKVVAIDIPSGLCGDNGRAVVAVKADKTIAIQCEKYGHYLNDGKDCCGEMSVLDIGINMADMVDNTSKTYIVEAKDLAKMFPKRRENSNKGDYGKAVIIGGCINYIGAVKLANMGLASLRAGAGLSVVAVPGSLAGYLASSVVESTVYPMAERDGFLEFDNGGIKGVISGANAIAIGMGVGNNYEETVKIIDFIIHQTTAPVLIDADGLNALASDMNILRGKKAKIIITPHPKEMSRLMKLEVNQVLDNPIEVAKSLAKKYNITVLLKGSSSVVTDGDEVFLINCGSPALAKGGSGDTLCGVILGLLAQGKTLVESGYCGSMLCALGAKKAENTFSEYGVVASDVAKEIAEIISKYNE